MIFIHTADFRTLTLKVPSPRERPKKTPPHRLRAILYSGGGIPRRFSVLHAATETPRARKPRFLILSGRESPELYLIDL